MCAAWNSVFCGLILCASADTGQKSCWTTDKTTVSEGGCLTIIVEKARAQSANLSIQINGGEARRLLEIGPSYHNRTSRLPGREDTLVLLFQDLVNPGGFEELFDEPGTYRPVMVFGEPGMVTITLYDGEESLGTKVVSVIPSSLPGQKAVELLRPKLGRGYRGQRDELLWSQLIIDSSAHNLTEREVALLRGQLPIMKEHPDWAEIAEMALARAEARHFARSLIEDVDGKLQLKQNVEDIELPQHIREARSRKVINPFAQAIQDEISISSTLLSHLKAVREQKMRSEDRN